MKKSSAAGLCFWLIVSIMVTGCNRGSTPSEGADTDAASSVTNVDQRSDWDIYADDFIRFSHPRRCRAFGPREAASKSPKRSYVVMGVADVPPLPGPEAIFLMESTDDSGRSLREIVVGKLKSAAKEQERLIGTLQNHDLPGGRCISYLQEGYTAGDVGKPVRRMISLRAECETDRKVHVEANSLTEDFTEPGRPSAQAVEQIQVFERVVKSIEFK